MITLVIVFICIHYVISGVILASMDISPSDIGGIKAWKAFILGGFLLVLHKSIGVLIGKLKVASFNWSLREWIER